MSIDRQTDQSAALQIGPTSEGMVRIYVSGESVDLPMDFEPGEAREIAEELLAAAARADAGGRGAKRGRAGRR